MRSRQRTAIALAFALLVAVTVPAASAARKTPGASATWTGQGVRSDGSGGYTLATTRCAPDPGSDTTGDYLLFVLASTKALSSPAITIGDGTSEYVSAAPMTKNNGARRGTSSYTYLFVSAGPIDLASLVGHVVVSWPTGGATPTLTVGHGCAAGAAGASLAVTYLGELADSGGPTYTSLGSYWHVGPSLGVCEHGSAVGCLGWSSGTAPATEGSVTLSGAGRTLDITLSDSAAGCTTALLFSSAVAAADASAAHASYLETVGGSGTMTTTHTFSGGDHLWIASYCAT